MLTKEQITMILREQYPYLAQEYGIQRLGLFGSYAQGIPHEQSDIDLIAEFRQPIGLKFIALLEYLEQLLGKPVDVLTPAGIQGIRKSAVSARNSKDDCVCLNGEILRYYKIL